MSHGVSVFRQNFNDFWRKYIKKKVAFIFKWKKRSLWCSHVSITKGKESSWGQTETVLRERQMHSIQDDSSDIVHYCERGELPGTSYNNNNNSFYL